MKTKNKLFLKLRLHAIDGGEGGGGGEGNQNPDTPKSNANSENQNKGNDNVSDFSNLWHTEENKPNEGTVQNVNVINQQQPVEKTPQQRLDTHLTELNLTDGFDSQAMQDPETAQKVMEQLARNVYTAAMKDANVIMGQQITQLREELQTETQNTLQGDQIIRDMNNTLAFTSKPAYKPIADSLVTRFLEKGDTPAKAIENVSLYFQNLQKEVSSSIPQPANDRLRNNNFGNGSNLQPNQQEETQDWVKFFNAN